jgi:hypothetical protein
MTVDEAIKAAGPGYELEGLTDEKQVTGFRVLTRDRREIAVFNRAGRKLASQSLSAGADTLRL